MPFTPFQVFLAVRRKQFPSRTFDELRCEADSLWKALPALEKRPYVEKSQLLESQHSIATSGVGSVDPYVIFFFDKCPGQLAAEEFRDFSSLNVYLHTQWQAVPEVSKRLYSFRARHADRTFLYSLGRRSYEEKRTTDTLWPCLAEEEQASWMCSAHTDAVCRKFALGEDLTLVRTGFDLYERIRCRSDQPLSAWQKLNSKSRAMYEKRVVDFQMLEGHSSFVCNACFQSYSSKEQLCRHRLREHLRTQHGVCMMCEYQTRDGDRLHLHLMEVHGEQLGFQRNDIKAFKAIWNTKSDFSCADCSLQLQSKAKLDYHRLKTHGKWREKVECSVCHLCYSSESSLRKHVRNVHSKGQGSKTKPCPRCPFKAQDHYHLTIHMRKHTGERPFKCDRCEHGFSKASDLKRHEASCAGVKYRCEKCGSRFHRKNLYQHHMAWSDLCGDLSLKTSLGSKGHYPPSMVKIHLSRDKVVVGAGDQIERLVQDEKGSSQCLKCSENSKLLQSDGDARPVACVRTASEKLTAASAQLVCGNRAMSPNHPEESARSGNAPI